MNDTTALLNIANAFLLENNFESPIRIGEGIHSIVFYTSKDYEDYVVKIYKYDKDLSREIIVLRKTGDYIKQINPFVYLLKYRGESLDKIDITLLYSLEECLEKLMIMLTDFHKRGYLHNDIKPDNICYDPKNDSFHLVDMGNISCYYEYNENVDNMYNEYNRYNAYNEYEYKYFRGNMYWSLRACIRPPYKSWCMEDDIESLLLMVWHLYCGPLPWMSLYTHNTHNTHNTHIIVELRENLDHCPHPLLRDLLEKNRYLKKNK